MTRLDPASRAAARGLSDLTIRNLFIIPTIAFLIIFNIFPLIYSLGSSFTDFRASTNAPANFVGLQNYRELLNDPFIWRNFTITAKYVLVSVTGQVLVGFGLAMLLNRDIPLKGLITTLLLLPMMLSMAVVGLFWKLLYDPSFGIINYALGLGKFEWLANPDMALYAVAITDIWMWSPFVMLLSLAGLSAVPKHLYEAAAIDRAGPLYTFFRITLPLVAPILMIAIIFRTMEAFKTFDLAYILTSQPTTELIAIRLYKMAFQEWQTGPLLRVRLHRADHGAGDHQHLREVPQPGEGALRWPRSAPRAERALNRAGDRRRPGRHADLPGADLLDRLDRLQAAQPRHHGAADGVLHAGDLALRQALHQALAAARAADAGGATRPRPGGSSWSTTAASRWSLTGDGEVQLSAYPDRFMNSLIVAIASTFLAVGDGDASPPTASRASGSRASTDRLFFILSTRMLPPVVVAIPMFLMYRAVGLNDTHLGLIILYTAFNLSFSVWLMKGFIDEIPKEYEEAALVDGYTRLQAFFKIVLPEARPASPRPPSSASSPPGTSTPSR